jgi:hypothetical protein
MNGGPRRAGAGQFLFAARLAGGGRGKPSSKVATFGEHISSGASGHEFTNLYYL